MTAESAEDLASSSFRLAAKTIIDEFCGDPITTATLILRLKRGTIDISSLDPISRLALSELRVLYGELEHSVRNYAQEPTSSTSEKGDRMISLLQEDSDANQNATLDRLAQQFLTQKKNRHIIRHSRSNSEHETEIKFVKTTTKSSSEVLDFVSGTNNSSIERSPQKRLPLITNLPREQTSDSEQSSIASGSSKSSKYSKRSSKSASSKRNRPPSSGSSSSRASTSRESYASTSSTHTSYDSGDVRLVGDSTIQLDMVARQVTAHLMQNEQFVEQLKVLQAAGLPLKSPDVLMFGQTPLIEKIQAIAQAGVSVPVLLMEPTIASQPMSLSDDPPRANLIPTATRADNTLSSQESLPLAEPAIVIVREHAKEDAATEIEPDHFLDKEFAVPVETQTDVIQEDIQTVQEDIQAVQDATPESSSISQDISSSTNQSLSVGEVPFKTMARLAPNLNIVTVQSDGSVVAKQLIPSTSIITQQSSDVDAKQPVPATRNRKPKVSEWLQGQQEHFAVPILDLSTDSSSTAAVQPNRDRIPIEVVSALRGKNGTDADEEDSSTLDQVTEMSASSS